MSEHNITVKVSGAAIYKAVKQYITNSPELQLQIKQTMDKLLTPAMESAIKGALAHAEYEIRQKAKVDIDIIVKREVEAKVADYISKGIKNMFEGKS